MVLCSPSNPSGAVCPLDIILQIQKLCEERGIWLISDEAYEDFVYDGEVCDLGMRSPELK